MSTELNKQVAALMGRDQLERLGYFWDRDYPTIEKEGAYYPFEPDESEGDAGLVQDRLASFGWMVTVYTGPYPGHEDPIARCCIMRKPGDAVLGGMVAAIADTRPLAICGAFVEAMERWGDGK